MISKLSWHKLDNIAKIFSVDDKDNMNIFRYTIILRKNIDRYKLRQALKETLKVYSFFKVKMNRGFFWNYLAFNYKEPVIEKEKNPKHYINFKKNNDYLFRITYYENIIYLDVFHVLTDGLGAKEFLQTLVMNYLDVDDNFEIKLNKNNDYFDYRDQYLINYDKKLRTKSNFSEAYQFEDAYTKEATLYNFSVNLNLMKVVCKKKGVTITEYITALYVYGLYLKSYNKKSKKDIVITVPIDLRKYYQVDTLSNFFVCMNVKANVNKNDSINFDELLNQIHVEFSDKLNYEKIKEYLTNDVKLGTNIFIYLIPLFIKKGLMNLIGHLFSRGATTTVSNVGIINFADKYKFQIENITVAARPVKNQKIKCTICSYEDNLNITISSNIKNKDLEYAFMELLQKEFDDIKLVKSKSKLY